MKWTTIQRKVSDLIPYEANPRQMTEKQNKDLRASLEKFDLVEIPAINTDGIILAGHQRLRIMQALGRGDEVIDVRMPDRTLTPKEVQEYNIRSNKNTGEFDFDILANSFETTDLLEWGFDEKDLKIDTDIEEDDFDTTPSVEPTTKVGDLYRLGNHRLLCGDATKIEDVERLMDGKKADMVFTDPPYGVSYASKNEYLNSISRGNRIQTPIENDHMGLEDTSEFVYKLFIQIKAILAPRSSYYITAPQGGDLMMMMMMMMKAGMPLRHCLIWVKNNHVLGRTDYNYKHEPILYGWVDVHDFYGGGEHKFSTWEIDKPLKNDLHPTMKPVALVVNAIKNSTTIDMVVTDLCAGSGTTLVACEQTNRHCYMMEISEAYCDVIISRWETLTGKKAELING